jgi:succinate dehydrogenase / fumarate reductase membrane anchor subunit
MSTASRTPSVPGTPGFWWWFFQRLSGVFLLFLVLLHGWFSHFVPIEAVQSGLQEEVVTYTAVKQRLTHSFFIALDFALLVVVLYHGLNGIRNISLEWSFTARRQGAVLAVLWVLGLGAFLLGARTLLAFML